MFRSPPKKIKIKMFRSLGAGEKAMGEEKKKIKKKFRSLNARVGSQKRISSH